MIVFFLSPLINVAMHHMDLMDAINVLFLLGGTLYWWPMVGIDPIMHWKMNYGGRMLNILLGTGIEAFLGVAILASSHPIASMYSLPSTHSGGALLWVSTEFVTLGAFLPIFIQWMHSEERIASRYESTIDRDGAPQLLEQPAGSAAGSANGPTICVGGGVVRENRDHPGLQHPASIRPHPRLLTPPPSGPPARVRILCRNENGEILLLKWRDPLDAHVFWEPPGGGIEPGEEPEEAAVRELYEETGFTTALGRGDAAGRTRLRLCRTPPPTHRALLLTTVAGMPTPAEFSEQEIATFLEARFIHPSELGALDAPLEPPHLGSLIAELIPGE